MSDSLPSPFSTPEMERLCSSEARLERMLAFEAALARAEARAGVIPSTAAEAITAACQPAHFQPRPLELEAVRAGTLAIPLVRALTAQVDAAARPFVHLGATSQDVIDTAQMLQCRDAIELISADLWRVCAAAADQAQRFRDTPMVGRTLLQHAVPITFGLKAARWLLLGLRLLRRLEDASDRSLAVQLGGAAGTLAPLGEHGISVIEHLASELGLAAPDLPWHAERDRVADLAAAFGIVAGGASKIALDVALLSETDVAEVAEAPAQGKGGSSAMAHKRNPIETMQALAAARLALGQVSVVLAALPQEHERGMGTWQTEWTALPDLLRWTGGAVDRVARVLEGLVVSPERMHRNLEATGGRVMAEGLTAALAQHLGRQVAFDVVQAASEQPDFRRALAVDARVSSILSPDQIDALLEPTSNLGSARAFVDRALALYRAEVDQMEDSTAARYSRRRPSTWPYQRATR